MLAHVVAGAVALLPVAAFLAVLLYLDSYKLVRLRDVAVVLAAGAAVTLLAFVVNGAMVQSLRVSPEAMRAYVAPVGEEVLKGIVVVVLVRTRRIGFLVEAAIFGFAIGTGFALVENLYYLDTVDAGLGTWIVRGFGTAIMHGGASAAFAIAGLALSQRSPRWGVLAFVPGAFVAIVLHAAFNQLAASPRVATTGIVLAVPALLYLVFEQSNKAVGDWLGPGFDADAEMLQLINSGGFSESPIGRYLTTLKARFTGPIVADLLCYLRLYTELSLRAKGMLMMRESGFDLPLDDATREKFVELRYLEGTIGRTALLAIHPMLHLRPRELWQVYRLER